MFSNSELPLDSRAFYRYIANHMTRRLGQNKRKLMNHVRFFAIGAVLPFAITAAAQQTGTSTGTFDKADLPSAQEQLKVLTQKLDLSSDQQAKIKPVLEQLHDATLKIMEDRRLSHDERLAKVRPWRYEADKKIRAILNEDQKRKLDEYEHGPHPEVHGKLSGKTQ